MTPIRTRRDRALSKPTLQRVRAIIVALQGDIKRMTPGNLAHERNCALSWLDGLKRWADEATGHKEGK